jgi:PTS system nitrogen regulatory IIA component
MKLSDMLSLDVVEADLKAKDKTGIITEMVDILVKAGKIKEKEKTISAVLAREELMSTGIGHGVAIPHAKSDTVDKIVAAFGRSKAGVDFKALDGEPVHLFFLLIASENTTSLHIKALARISRLLKHHYVREMLKNSDSSEEILKIIKEEEAKHL